MGFSPRGPRGFCGGASRTPGPTFLTGTRGKPGMVDFANLLPLWRQAADERAEIMATAKVASRRLQEA